MKNSEQTSCLTIEVFGRGSSKQAAIAEALGSIQKKLMLKNTKVFLRVEPIEAKVKSAMEVHTKEKFLFFFFPRVRISYEVILEIDVRVTTIDPELIQFEEIQSKENDRLLHLFGK